VWRLWRDQPQRQEQAGCGERLTRAAVH
jgi:hypothetical protein